MAENQQTLTVTVTVASPNLKVIADGAVTAVPADQQRAYNSDGTWFIPVYTVGLRLQAVDRTPQIPLVTGSV